MANKKLFRIMDEDGGDFFAEGLTPEAALASAYREGQRYDKPVEVFEETSRGHFTVTGGKPVVRKTK